MTDKGMPAMNAADDRVAVEDLGERERELHQLIRRIGVARFVGRVNSGLLSPTDGYKAIESYMSLERRRPIASRLAHLLLHRDDSYLRGRRE